MASKAPFTTRAVELGKNLYARFQDDEVPALGAQLTYYLLLSFFPFLIFLVSLLGFLNLNGDELIADMIAIMPAEGGDTVRTILGEVSTGGSGALLSVGMIGTIWAASNGVNAIIKGLNKAYDEEEDRPFWKVRGLSLLATVVLAVVVILVVVLLVFGRGIGEFLFEWLSYPAGFEATWAIIRYVLPLAAMVLVFTLLYWITPNRRLTFRQALPGACFASLGWVVTSVAFSFYVSQFGNYTKTYGSLGGVIVLLVWLYLSSIIIVLGGEINAALHFGSEGVEKKRPAKSFGLRLFRKKGSYSGRAPGPDKRIPL
ncbi:YihY/virulence factor BrkB family protein [Paenibacillus albicereus]|uniref:YihY/virulence factor BrkB family protein n=1 Tax=Paenibacillus albicereus TaxID=2726185 RepID=A0A6H2GZX7_9BACL|nr:YihY/virulence factor BrkB family protein [Paenibacillus albicereus]QJC52970.1 YihY/virulence factor BrkB family protein [Paenibacillus albicereus]